MKSELIIASDGTLYHLDIKRADKVPPNLILVGAASRVDEIAKHFDEVRFSHINQARPEFHLALGTYKGVEVGALSVGIGTPSMEIVCNELHALFEYDYEKNKWQRPSRPINIIRLGTCGTCLPDVPLGALAISKYSIGLDNAGVYYPPVKQDKTCQELRESVIKTKFGKVNPALYVAPASPHVVEILEKQAARLGIGCVMSGLTTSSPGFFAAEGRTIGRMKTAFSLKEFIQEVEQFSYQGMRIINHEMETSILFRIMQEILGYNVGAVCLVLDNLRSNEVIAPKEYKKYMESAIMITLDVLAELSGQAPQKKQEKYF